jgi:prepilin-type N-terminal cleavage/methylation domain-containing protein
LNTNHGTVMRGMTLIEVSIALAVLGIASLGLAGTLVVSSNSNSMAARRTVMSAFAQARIESLSSMTRTKIPINGSDGLSTTFNPMADPNTGGWVMDQIDGASTIGGDDLFFGPVLVDPTSQYGAEASATLARTLSLRTSVPNCADKAVTSDPGVLCREVHIESYCGSGGSVCPWSPRIPMLRAYVRVIQGGGSWKRSYVLLQQDIAQ